MITLTKTFEFASSHRLWRDEWSEEKNIQVFGKCARGHGHNYRLEVSVEGPINEETGMVIDARTLEAIVKEHILSVVDHKCLDTDVEWFAGKLTTVENIVDVFWIELSNAFKAHNDKLELYRIKLWETGRMFATRERDRS